MLGFEVRRIQTLVGFMKRFVTHLLGYRLIIGQGRVRFAGPKVEHQNQRIETNVHTPKWAPQMGAQSGLYVWSPFLSSAMPSILALMLVSHLGVSSARFGVSLVPHFWASDDIVAYAHRFV